MIILYYVNLDDWNYILEMLIVENGFVCGRRNFIKSNLE